MTMRQSLPSTSCDCSQEEIMSRDLVATGTLALLLGGCASSAELENRPTLHEQRARERAQENKPVPPPPPPPGDY